METEARRTDQESTADDTSALGGMVKRLGAFHRTVDAGNLADLGTRTRFYSVDTPIWSDPARDDHLFVIDRGFAFAFSILPDGRRFISDIYGPGAICNWSRLNDARLRTDILIKRRSNVARIPIKGLRERARDVPALSVALTRHEHTRTLRASRRTRSLVVGNANEKVMHTLLDIRDELGAVEQRQDWFVIPFTQVEWADTIGVSFVHLNRTIKDLVEAGRVVRNGRRYQIADLADEFSRLEYRRSFHAGDREDEDLSKSFASPN